MKPMEVRCVIARGIHSHDPELDQSWSDLEKLRWLAGILQAETGIECRITEMAGGFAVNHDFVSHSSRPFAAAWALLNGMSAGALAIIERVPA